MKKNLFTALFIAFAFLSSLNCFSQSTKNYVSEIQIDQLPDGSESSSKHKAYITFDSKNKVLWLKFAELTEVSKYNLSWNDALKTQDCQAVQYEVTKSSDGLFDGIIVVHCPEYRRKEGVSYRSIFKFFSLDGQTTIFYAN